MARAITVDPSELELWSGRDGPRLIPVTYALTWTGSANQLTPGGNMKIVSIDYDSWKVVVEKC